VGFTQYDFIVMFPVKPTTVARYRSAFRPSGAKDDPSDAEVILELLMTHRDKLERLAPERSEMRQLRRLVELRRDLVNDRTRLTNRITDALKAYFPQVLSWGDKQDPSGSSEARPPAATACWTALAPEYLQADLDQLVIVEDGVGGHDGFGRIELGVSEPSPKSLLDALIVQVHVGGSLQLSEAYSGSAVEQFVR
jgi:hypothetical protein